MIRVAVVDDHQIVRDGLVALLGALDGIEVVGTAADGQDAVHVVGEVQPDVVVMDIQMPHVSGLDLIEAMQSEADLKPIPVLAVTAYAGKGDEERIRDAGAKDYLAKPVSIGPFMAAVRALLADEAPAPALDN